MQINSTNEKDLNTRANVKAFNDNKYTIFYDNRILINKGQ